jgi:dihydrofolate reductase
MRTVRYGVAASLDGYIAGPDGEYDWILTDPDIDFGEIMGRYDTFLVGRKTWETMRAQGEAGQPRGKELVVFSRTLGPAVYPGVTIVSGDAGQAVRALKEKPGKEIALFGGGDLFRSLLEEGVVDKVEVAVIPGAAGHAEALPTPSLREDGHDAAGVRRRGEEAPAVPARPVLTRHTALPVGPARRSVAGGQTLPAASRTRLRV